MDIIALAGGYGTRLGELTIDKPKALLDINSTPILQLILNKVDELDNVGTVYIVSNQKFYEQLCSFAKTAQCKYPIEVLNDGTTCNEDRLEIMGDIHFAIKEKNIQNDILVIGTDNLITGNIQRVVDKSNQMHASAAGFFEVANKMEATKYGIALIDNEHKVLELQEKPQEPPSLLSVMMLWSIVQEDFKHLEDNIDTQGRGPKGVSFISYLAEHSQVYAVTYSDPWIDIGTPEEYERAQQLIR